MRIKRTPLERIEYAIIVSTLLLLVVVTVQPLLNLLAISLSDPAKVAGMSGLTVIPSGFSLDVWSAAAAAPARAARHPQLAAHHHRSAR